METSEKQLTGHRQRKVISISRQLIITKYKLIAYNYLAWNVLMVWRG